MANLALVAQIAKGSDRLLKRHDRVGCVQLVEVDAVYAQPPEASLAAFPQPLWPSVLETAVAWPEAALRRNHEIFRVGIQRLRDQFLADLRPVRVGRVDQVNPELEDPAEQLLRCVPILRRPRAPLTQNAKRPETEPANLEVAPEHKGVCCNHELRGQSGRVFTPAT